MHTFDAVEYDPVRNVFLHFEKNLQQWRKTQSLGIPLPFAGVSLDGSRRVIGNTAASFRLC